MSKPFIICTASGLQDDGFECAYLEEDGMHCSGKALCPDRGDTPSLGSIASLGKIVVRTSRCAKAKQISEGVWECAELAADYLHCDSKGFCVHKYESPFDAEDVPRVTGTDAGVKHDIGKNRLSLLFGGFPNAIWHAGLVTTMGASKYTSHGWRKVPDGVERYSDAMYRHLLQHETGEEFDEESGHLHLAHALWNLMALLELTIRERMGE